MRKKLKYIRFETGFVVFSEPMTHKEIKFTESSFGITEKPISAGFFSFIFSDDDLIVKCYGESISLNLKSLPEDSELLTKQMNGEW